MNLSLATKPTMYFIGVTTGRSSINRVFPRWARRLGLGDCQLLGLDFALHDAPEKYRAAVEFIARDPLSLGALVTTHKIDLLRASRDLFAQLDPLAELLSEVSCLSKTEDGKLIGHAVDPITCGLAMRAFLPADYWRRSGAEVFLLGAGGSSIATTHHLMTSLDWPAKIHVANRSHPRLEEMRAFHAKLGSLVPVEYYHHPTAEQNDAVMAGLPHGSLVINATGLGKDAPGSPITPQAPFPHGGHAWEYNYRGDLIFLEQARVQAATRDLAVHDGWIYFLHGWTRVMAEVFHLDIPSSGPLFEELAALAADAR